MRVTSQQVNFVKLILFSASLILLSFFSFYLEAENISIYIILFLVLSVFHFSNIDNPLIDKHIFIILGIAFFAKLVLIYSEPFFSNDIFRYFLDGNLSSNGILPYSISPKTVIENKVLIESPLYLDLINHKQYSTIYLFLPEFVFLISALTLKLKLLYLLIEISFLIFIYKKKRESFQLVSLITLHPLYIVETYSSGHFDFLFLLLIIVFYEFYDYRKIRNVAYLLSVMTKGFSLFFLKLNKRSILVISLAISLLIVNLLIIDQSPENGLNAYHESFSFNNPIYEYLNTNFQKSYHEIQEIMPYQIFNKTLTLLIVSLIAILSFRKFSKEKYYLGLLFSFIFIFGSATIHPWYLLLLIYFSLKLNLKTLLFMTYTIFISYVVLIDFMITELWELNEIFFWFIYLPFIVKLAIELYQLLQKVYSKCQQYFSKMS